MGVHRAGWAAARAAVREADVADVRRGVEAHDTDGWNEVGAGVFDTARRERANPTRVAGAGEGVADARRSLRTGARARALAPKCATSSRSGVASSRSVAASAMVSHAFQLAPRCLYTR